MRVGVYSPYFKTMGGGERYALTVTEFFLKNGDEVTIFDNEELDKNDVKDRFDLNISQAKTQKKLSTFGYDLCFFVSDGSIPFSLAKRNILHFQVPFKYQNQKTLLNKIKLTRFNHIVCNSQFTKTFIDETYGVKSEVLYPPVDVEKFKSGKKENIILSVGRFFAPSNPKKQEVLIKTFKELNPKDWELVLIGGVFDANIKIQNLQKMIGKNKIKIVTDSSFKTLQSYYAKAKIYWHAAGFGEDLEKHPDKAEHFGISTVEAMAAGCVPIVFAGGGQLEIVDKNNGFFWSTIKELKSNTQKLILDKNLIDSLSKQAIVDSKRFSKEKFYENLAKII